MATVAQCYTATA